MMEEQAAILFQALANADRLRVIRALVAAGPAGLSAGEIAASISASPSRTSFHLATLSETGIIHSQRHSRTLIYSVDFQSLGGLANFLLNDCCKGNSVALSCCVNSNCK